MNTASMAQIQKSKSWVSGPLLDGSIAIVWLGKRVVTVGSGNTVPVSCPNSNRFVGGLNVVMGTGPEILASAGDGDAGPLDSINANIILVSRASGAA